jgi:CDGSH-type Zn-finger protein
VDGEIPLKRMTIVPDAAGESVAWRTDGEIDTSDSYALCRCGRSTSKPFCDGSHERADFNGTETASRAPYLDQAGEQVGPRLVLTDAPALCAFARFCDRAGQIWNLVERDDPNSADLTRREAADCPSGRLVAWEREGLGVVEPDLAPAIGVVADPQQGVAGPLWIQGGVELVGADGAPYERRNRVTVCRCGASRNKPFCDGSHAAIGFTDDGNPNPQQV